MSPSRSDEPVAGRVASKFSWVLPQPRTAGGASTPGVAQMACCQEKERQARALLVDAMPWEGEYSDIFNEIGITAASGGEVAMAVLAAAEKWRAFDRLVERTRLAGKKAMAAAADTAGIEAAAAVAWPG